MPLSGSCFPDTSSTRWLPESAATDTSRAQKAPHRHARQQNAVVRRAMLYAVLLTLGTAVGSCQPSSSPETETASPEASGSLPLATAASPSASGVGTRPLEVAIVETGFTAFAEGGGWEGGFASFAVILRNPNPAWSAELVTMRVVFRDGTGLVVGEQHLAMWSIPPLATTAIAGVVPGASDAATMSANIEPDNSTYWRAATPLDPGAVLFDEITTTVAPDGNQSTKGLIRSALAQAYEIEVIAVYRNDAGTIIGGQFGNATLPASSDVPFEMTTPAPFDGIAAAELYWFPLN